MSATGEAVIDSIDKQNYLTHTRQTAPRLLAALGLKNTGVMEFDLVLTPKTDALPHVMVKYAISEEWMTILTGGAGGR